MVKAELSYNPYLLESKVKLNGRDPYGNSQIEKYENCRLQDWVDELPKIFYDELNGYNFELDFCGTDLEYELLQNVFLDKLPDKNAVKLNHSKTYLDRKGIFERINSLMTWLCNNRCEYMNYEEFSSENEELFSFKTPIIVINGQEGSIQNNDPKSISLEYLDRFDVLAESNIQYSPIVVFIDSQFLHKLQPLYDLLKANKDFSEHQLFFIIDSTINKGHTRRFMMDLGIEKPNIVASVFDLRVMEYLDAYPISQTIYEEIKCIREKAEEIHRELYAFKEEKESQNKGVYNQLHNLEEKLEKIKEAENRFDSMEQFSMPQGWIDEENTLLKEISKYKEKNVVIIGRENAEKDAINYVNITKKNMQKFNKKIIASFNENYLKIKEEIESIFNGVELDIKYNGSVTKVQISVLPELRSFSGELMSCGKIKMVQEHGFIFAKKDPNAPLKEQWEFYLSDWRDIAYRNVQLHVNSFLEDYTQSLREYKNNLIEEYRRIIIAEKKRMTQVRASLTSSLSEEEKHLEANLNWLNEFEQSISEIERAQ